MTFKNQNIIKDNEVNLKLLLDTAKKPELFSTGEELFWDDPHISQKMLEYHLNPTCDEASYNHKAIDQIVKWLFEYLKLQEGSKILDLGCGPGLYCTRFFQMGFNVVGMDYSKNSIGYAVKNANENNMNIQYIYQNYLTMDYTDEFDAIFFISMDFGALSNTNRDLLLQKIYKALKPNGVLVFDVLTQFNRELQYGSNWYVCETGFYKPYPHLVLDQTFHYKEENVYLEQHTVIAYNGEITTYKIWDHYYSIETISQVVEESGFLVQDIWSDLTGKHYENKSKKLGIVVKKK